MRIEGGKKIYVTLKEKIMCKTILNSKPLKWIEHLSKY